MQRHLGRNAWLLLVLLAFASCAKKQSFLVSTANKNINISDKSGTADPDLIKMIEPYKESLDGKMNEVIGELTETMDKEKPNSSLMNFMADALFVVAKKKFPALNIDAAIMNYGGIRLTTMPKGILTVRSMYELMPFDNTVVLVTMDSVMVNRIFARIADYGGWPMSQGMSFQLANGQALHSQINGMPINSKNKWVFAMPNYVAEGGDNCAFLQEAKQDDTAIYIRDILIEYTRDIKKIEPDNTHRIIVMQ